MPTERFTFVGHDGSALAARLDVPNGPTLATALFAHCFACTKDIAAARRISSRLCSMGIAVLRFDFTGLGHSQGEFANTTFQSNAEDLVAAARALKERGMAPSLIIGHSLGGAAVIRARAQIASIRAVVTIASPFDPSHVTHNFVDALQEITETGRATLTLGGREITISRSFVDDLKTQNLTQALTSLGAAYLILHAPRDAIVGIENAAALFQAAKHPKSFVTLDDADHLITDPQDAEYAADVIATWAARYLDLRHPAPPPATPEGILRVSEADPSGFLQDIQIGPHHLLADEPLAYGGTHRGPSPYGLMSAALGACTSMTIRMYARRKGWPLAHVSVDVTHEKMHAQDANGVSNDKIDAFQRHIKLTGKLTTAQREKLLLIADKCPVHQTLERASHIETHLAESTQ